MDDCDGVLNVILVIVHCLLTEICQNWVECLKRQNVSEIAISNIRSPFAVDVRCQDEIFTFASEALLLGSMQPQKPG